MNLIKSGVQKLNRRIKAEKWDNHQKIMYDGYVKNLEERLIEKDLSFTEKVDYIFEKLKELRTKEILIGDINGRIPNRKNFRVY